MTDPTDLIARADAAILEDELFFPDPLARELRDALAAALARAEAAECHAEAMEAALREITETPARRHQIRIARAALTGETQP